MLSDYLKKLSKLVWFLPGFLLWAAYPPMGERMDCLFALAPLMWLSRREISARKVAKCWFQSGLFYWVATLSWMPAIMKNGGPWPLVVLGWFALAAYCAVYFGTYGYFSARIWRWVRLGSYGRRLLAILVFEPILWCGLELVRSRFLGGFSWNQLGVVPINSGFGAPAALGGVYLCSAVVILINGTIAGIVERMWKPDQSGFSNLRRWGAIETVLAFALIFGVYKMGALFVCDESSRETSKTRHLKVAMVQRNFPCVFKAQEENPYTVYERLLENVSVLRPDLVVLPESALCEFGPIGRQHAMQFAQWIASKTGGAALLAGGSRHEDGKIYNSAALYATNSVSIYDKVHLVPFGEFIPGDKWFPALQKFAPVGSCTAGRLDILKLGDVNLGVGICFEDTDSAQMRELAKKGAKALCFITNDSWFSQSNEAEQHAWQAVARAIETGLPVVRVGNSGVTGTITPDGRASWLFDGKGHVLVDQEGVMLDRLNLILEEFRPTPYVILGDSPIGLAFALLIIALILVEYRNKYE